MMGDVPKSSDNREQPTASSVARREAAFGENLRKMRTEEGLTQKVLAELMTERGVSLDQSTVARIERGARAVRLGEALVFAEVLDRSVDELVRGADDTSEVRRLRDDADRWMAEARSAVKAYLMLLDLIRERAERNPDALPEVAADEYKQWVLGRLRKLPRNDEAEGLWGPRIVRTKAEAALEQAIADGVVAGIARSKRAKAVDVDG